MGMSLWSKEVFYLPLKKGQRQALVFMKSDQLDFLESCHLRDYNHWRGDQKETPKTELACSGSYWFSVAAALGPGSVCRLEPQLCAKDARKWSEPGQDPLD